MPGDYRELAIGDGHHLGAAGPPERPGRPGPASGKVATLVQPGQPDRIIALPPRSDAECLSDELRRLDADEVYADTLVRGLGKVSGRKNGTTTKETTR